MSKGAAAFTVSKPARCAKIGESGAPSDHQDMHLVLTAIVQKRDLVAGQDLAVQRHLPHAPAG